MKVFLSSTFIDLIEHRKAAHDALERLGQEVGRMEIFGARSEEATSAALTQLEKCDLVLGIYAYRYGSIPEGSEVSITEQEYLHAKRKNKPLLCFVVDEDHLWSPKMMEKDVGKIKKLEEFKAKVLKEKVVDFFTSPADLGMKIATSVHNYLEELKAVAAEELRQNEIRVTVGGNFSGNLTIGNQNTVGATYQLPSISRRRNTLPPEGFFIGRDKEREIIQSSLSSESRTWGALIDGPGGIGKTALAIKAAYDAPEELFERKIFITAKVRELTVEGEKALTDFTRPTYLAMLDELGKELGEDGLEKLPPSDRPNELRLALASKKALIVFDNLETLPEEERTRLFQFLSRLPEGNKAIVTSRRRTDVDARIVRLDRLSHAESMQLVDELATRYPRLQRASQRERDELYEITQGNPLFIRWIAGQLGREGSQFRTIAEASSFIEKAPRDNDPLEYIFGDLLETFTESETKVLAALTHFTLPARLKWIADMTELPARAAETALEDLTDRSILVSNIESRTFLLPPLTAKFIRTRRPEVVIQTGDILTDRAYALAMQYGGSTNYEGFRTLDAEWDFVSAALPHLLTGDNARLQTVSDQLFQFLNYTGRWDEWLLFSEQAEARALVADDKEKAGWHAYRTGMTYFFRNQPAEVLACAARAAEHWQESTPRNKATALLLGGYGHEINKNYPAAITAYGAALDIYRSISPESDVVTIALASMAGAERANKNYSAAERDNREALRIAKIIKKDEYIANYTDNLAALALDREQWAEAESLAREALSLSEKVGRQELIANNCHRLAIALLKQKGKSDWQSDLQEALSLSRRAIEIYTRLRKSDSLQKAQKMLAEIEEKVKENRN
jgi:tetratricopeptide (TPR) repeat protein